MAYYWASVAIDVMSTIPALRRETSALWSLDYTLGYGLREFQKNVLHPSRRDFSNSYSPRQMLQNPIDEREKYLLEHQYASFYVDYEDFNFWKLTIEECRYVGGFGHMSWVQSEDYYKAEIDPLFQNAEGIISHMNDDHSDANTLYAKNLANLSSCSEAISGND